MPNVPAHTAGTVIRVEKGAGDAVAAGETILVLRAAGTEMPLESPASGRIRQIRVKEGQVVAQGDVLAVVE